MQNKPATGKSWHIDPTIKPPAGSTSSYVLIPAKQTDYYKVMRFYQIAPVPNMSIKRIDVIYDSDSNIVFDRDMSKIQKKANNSACTPKWRQKSASEQERKHREDTNRLLQTISKPYIDPNYPAVKLLPLWHGTTPQAFKGLLETGFLNLATTDAGFFGKGIYSAYEAEYAYRVYSNGTLLVNWVAFYSAYPVIKGDMDKLQGGANYENYDAHFIPVVPRNPHDPNEQVYKPCAYQQKHKYIEVVVFQSNQCLPRYRVELQPDLPITPQLKIEIQTLQKENQKLKNALEQALQQMTNLRGEAQKREQTIRQKNRMIQQHEQTIRQNEQELKNKDAQIATLHQQLNYQPRVTNRHASPGLFPQPPMSSPRHQQEKMQLPVSPQQLTQFFERVVEADFEAVEKMLKANKALAYESSDIIDLSDRTFTNITAFQYAVWALDWRMWKKIRECINDDDELRRQAQVFVDFDNGEKTGWQKRHGKFFDLQPLIKVLGEFVNMWSSWNGDQREHHWCKVVGGEQRKLPAHIVIEYCRQDHNFKTPDFMNGQPTIGYVDEDKNEVGVKWWYVGTYRGGKLGKTFAVARGGGACANMGWIKNIGGVKTRDDQKSLKNFLASRTQQVEQLLVESLTLTSQAGSGIRYGK